MEGGMIVVGLNHRTAPVEVREKLAFTDGEVRDLLSSLVDAGVVNEGVVLSTCNRVEFYLVSGNFQASIKEALLAAVATNKSADAAALKDHLYLKQGTDGYEHLFKVASGLDSMVLGETEILGQLKSAYQFALGCRFTGKALNKAFQRAFQLAKRIRSETTIQKGSTSVASVAVELAEKVFETLKDRDVLVLGAGDTSEKTARALKSRGAASILVSNRSYERADQLAMKLGGKAVHFDDWETVCHGVDIAISSTSAPHHVLDRERVLAIMKERGGRPLLLIDIAVPRDIDPAVNLLNDVYLYNVDDLQAIAERYLKRRKKDIQRCESMIAEAVREFLDDLARDAAWASKKQNSRGDSLEMA